MRKTMSIILTLTLMISMLPSQSFASSNSTDGLNSNNEDITDVDITEENYKIALEIAKSELESSVIVGDDGKFETTFTDYQSAEVSKKAFDKFQKTLNNFNSALDKEELVIKDPDLGLEGMEIPEFDRDFDIQDSTQDKVVSPMFTVIGLNHYALTDSDLSKVNKVIAAGGGASALAVALGVSIGVAGPVIAAALFLSAGLNLCNWNDNGVLIMKRVGVWKCYPLP